ncbi:NAD(P)-dependent dehydrogenase, short-chain alcohol dehydrogenase family [Shimia gijangensis]|uniref:NAD(P)-dependent dehydrogenase, short-chain alcohol dehydrogenase family n=1 Tax=Shimia gijangensis TaxID=1470563 RepID=A0A1M6IDS7_9RHOB|nr:glucose 1-dehydrogenase [Shimia gijangensis]SHJ32611.1 NAD(P)-dependent dehydrogenase, short-chain alcohol dehydrogenase family [Shimia gijangensis]
MGRVEGKVALVTGAAMGLGKAIAMMLSKEGAKLIVTDINADEGQRTADEINAMGKEALFLHHDVADPARWVDVTDTSVDRFGRLDVMVNNAGIALAADIETTTVDDWRKTMAINMDGVFYGTQQAVRVMKANRSGSIINLSSIDGIIGEADLAAYCASKGGVRTFTKSVAVHCGEAGYGIRVNSIHPGYIVTAQHKSYLTALGKYEEENEKARARHPIGHLGEPDDIAYGALYLASDESKFVTGSELVIDGGYLAR